MIPKAYDGVLQADTSYILSLLESSDRILVKKLSNNDREWSQKSNLHQAGVYIPPRYRDGGFFPRLAKKQRDDAKAKEIWEVFFPTKWPQFGDEKRTRLVHYTSKGPETHLTGLPKVAFGDLLPASLLVIGRVHNIDGPTYTCLTIQSDTDDAVFLYDLLNLDADFHIGEFNPKDVKSTEVDQLLDFAEQVIAAWLKGEIAAFASQNAAMPTTFALADMARKQYLGAHGLTDLNPFKLACPGDSLREISRTIEWDLFRGFQRKERAVALVRLLLGDSPIEMNVAAVIRRLVEKLQEVDALMLSASQQRKARAGYSFEHHIEAMLLGGAIPFEKQVIIDAKKRPDFVLPSLANLKVKDSDGFVLSAKTTLRERWKQVQREQGVGSLYLVTVDENIAGNAIEDMASLGICLVVPETLKKSKDTEYDRHKNVMSFQHFLLQVVRPRLPNWR